MASFGLVALASSVYLVLVLEILKFRRFRERQLRRQELSTGGDRARRSSARSRPGEFEAVDPPG